LANSEFIGHANDKMKMVGKQCPSVSGQVAVEEAIVAMKELEVVFLVAKKDFFVIGAVEHMVGAVSLHIGEQFKSLTHFGLFCCKATTAVEKKQGKNTGIWMCFSYGQV
jgi:hypothetical protein